VYLSNESILVILFVGLIAGWLAGKIVRGTGFGIIGDIVVGIAGALVASFLFPRLGIHLGVGLVSEILDALIGAVILLVIVRLVRGRRSVLTLLRFGRTNTNNGGHPDGRPPFDMIDIIVIRR
jgi:uncharacterized membrane protein YeaQ/YmgE (transglycosylase-associated protein family)